MIEIVSRFIILLRVDYDILEQKITDTKSLLLYKWLGPLLGTFIKCKKSHAHRVGINGGLNGGETLAKSRYHGNLSNKKYE